jgi:hypothetical protein
MTKLPPNQSNQPSFGRKARKPYASRKWPQNRRLRCDDCGAQFYEKTQATQFDLHCLNMGAKTSHGGQYGLHHGFSTANPRPGVPRRQSFRRVSDAVADLKKWLAEYDEDH